MPAHWRVELGLGPLVGRAMFRGSSWLRKSLGSLSADGFDCVPAHCVVCLNASQHLSLWTAGWGQVLVPKCQPPQELTHADECSLIYQAPESVSPGWATATSPGDPPRPADRSSPGFCQITAFALGPVHVRFCVCTLRVKSLFPPFLWNSCNQAPLAFKAKCSGGSSSPCQTPGLGVESDRLRTLTSLGELLQYNYSLVCGLHTWGCGI